MKKKLILNFDLNSLAKRTMYSDENIIKQVMETLLQNALETTETGSIQVVVSHPDNEFLEISGFNIPQNLPEKSYLMVKVIDTGSGLPVKDISSIFDPYMDIDKYIAKKAVAKGLELGIVYQLVKLIKGKLWVETDSLKGSSFAFIIPIEKINI